MMKDLIDKLLNEQTTPEEEHLIAQELRQEDDIDRWLTEDETAEYDRIVSQRHSNQRWLRWAAVTTFLVVIAAGAKVLYTKHLSGHQTTTDPSSVSHQPQQNEHNSIPQQPIDTISANTVLHLVNNESPQTQAAVSQVPQESSDDCIGIRQRILNYYARVPQEIIYIHTDRPYYVPGDTVWFRAHLVDAVTRAPISRSRYVYVELLDNAADTLIQRVIVKCDPDGVFANQLILPRHLHSGTYTLAAYTQWMRNFPVDRFYYKQLTVVGNGTSVAVVSTASVATEAKQTINPMLILAQRKGQLLVQYSEPTYEPLSCIIYGSGNLLVTDYTQGRVLKIDSHSLRPGNISIAMVNRKTGTVIAENLTTIEGIQPQITISGKARSKNELMELSIDLAEADGTPLNGTFSLSVTDYDVVKPDTQQPAIDEYLMHSPDRYALSDILKDIQPDIRYSFQTSQTISGQIHGTIFKKIKHPKLMLVRPDTGLRHVFELGDSNRFVINGLDFPDGTTYLLEGMRQTGSTNLVQLKIDKPTYPMLHTKTIATSSVIIPDDFARRAKEQVMYGSTDHTIELPEVIKEKKRRHKPEGHGQLEPFRAFYDDMPILNNASTIETLLSSLGLRFTKKADGNITLTPLIFIDDTESNEEELLMLQPESIKSIEYYKPTDSRLLVYRWDAPSRGVLDIRRKVGYHSSKSKPLSMATVQQQGYQPSREFFSPQYPDPSAKTRPDHRTTLYWNPKLKTDGNGHATVKFYASDISKRYLVTLEGVSDDGIVVHKEVTVTAGSGDFGRIKGNRPHDLFCEWFNK